MFYSTIRTQKKREPYVVRSTLWGCEKCLYCWTNNSISPRRYDATYFHIRQFIHTFHHYSVYELRCIGSDIITSLDIYRCNVRGSNYTLEVSHISECLRNNASCKRLLYVHFLFSHPKPALAIDFNEAVTSARRGLILHIAYTISSKWNTIRFCTIRKSFAKVVVLYQIAKQNQEKCYWWCHFPWKVTKMRTL